MHKKKMASILLAGLLAFIPTVIVEAQGFQTVEQGVSVEVTKAVTKGENYNTVKKNYDISTVYEITGSGDVSAQFADYLNNNCKDLTKNVMIYFPSGNYELNNDIYFVLHSKVYIVAEKDTVIKMTGSQASSMLRTVADEKAADILIYGGTWNGNGNGTNIFEFSSATGVLLKNAVLKNAASNGVMLYNASEGKMENVTVEEEADEIEISESAE